MTHPLQSRLPYDISNPPDLPGTRPFDEADWLHRDDAFEGQMAERDRLIAEHPGLVIAMDEGAREAAVELLDRVLAVSYAGMRRTAPRPDGMIVPIDRAVPLATLGRIAQEDFCILQKRGDEHVLTGAVLCFPASWSLAEKFMRPLTGVHEPVAEYDDNIARRVQRLFEGVRVGQPIWRFNALWYAEPDLFQPRSETDPRPERAARSADFMRSERQCILRLPETEAVIFSIHTYVVPRAAFVQVRRPR